MEKYIEQARTLDPMHPHVAGRLAEVQRRQHAASATPLVKRNSRPRHPRAIGAGCMARDPAAGGDIMSVKPLEQEAEACGNAADL